MDDIIFFVGWMSIFILGIRNVLKKKKIDTKDDSIQKIWEDDDWIWERPGNSPIVCHPHLPKSYYPIHHYDDFIWHDHL